MNNDVGYCYDAIFASANKWPYRLSNVANYVLHEVGKIARKTENIITQIARNEWEKMMMISKLCSLRTDVTRVNH